MNEDPNPDWCDRANKQKINLYSGATEKAKCSHKTKPINPNRETTVENRISSITQQRVKAN